MAYSAWLTDSGTVNVQVTDKTHSVVDATTAQGAFVSYFGSSDVTFGSSGTGVFDPFVRLQGSPTEQGYNTNGTVEFDTKTGTWTHAQLVSHIPQRPCPQASPSLTCFELFVDINENNSTSYVSLNKVEVYFTNSATLTGYPFSSTATAQYKFGGDVLIHDVNQGSGRGDLRYDIPINGPNPITIPANCNYGNPLCSTYFVLYSEWGTSTAAAPDGHGYSSDGGFEEWQVHIYPAISLTKTPNVTNVCNGSNTSVTYTYVVTNTSIGSNTVSGSIVDDNGTPGNTGDDVTVGTYSGLAQGASQTFTHTFTVNGTRTNIATTTASDSNGNTATASATATVTGHNCTISLTKTPSTTNVCNGSNTSVTYTYVVTNNSDFFTATGTVSDDKFGNPVGAFTNLPPGESVTITKAATVNATVTNTATATATFNDSKPTTATATASATVTGHTCTISLTKTPSQTSVCNGTSVTYTYVVTNNSDFFTWTGSLTDDTIALPAGAASFSVDPGKTATFTVSSAITGAVTNTATASGAFNDPSSTTASATKSATVTGHVCTISLTKTPSQTSVCNGSTVNYTIVVTNNSDAFDWTGSVVDNVLGTLAASVTIPKSSSVTYTPSGTINGTVTNTVTANGKFNDPASSSATKTATATVTGHVCTISVSKTPSQTSVCNGSTVNYTIVVTNNSDAFDWTGSVVDDKLGSLASSVTIPKGGHVTYTPSGTITGTVKNTVTASGAFNDPATSSASNTASVTVTGHDCTISLTKTPDQTSVCNGSLVTYTYMVTNNSDAFTWTGKLTDDTISLPAGAASFSLAPGGSKTFTASSTITGAVTNTATASGAFNDPSSTTASDTKQATVTGHACTISLTKTPDVTNVCNGKPVTYTYVVTNNNDAFTWTGSLTDDIITLPAGAASFSIAPGKSVTFTVTGSITGAVTNTATASGAFNDPSSTTASDTKQATVTGHDCTISLTKTPSQTSVCNGTSVTYTYKVTNNSDAFTWTGTLTDDKLGAIDGTITLAPGASQTFTASSAITGGVTNTATASGAFNDPASTSASATKSATVNGHACTISLTKTPSATNVCNGAGTQVTYTYVVKNTGDTFNASGSVSDDQFGSVGSFGPLAPGASQTLTKVATVNGSVTNTATATATFADPDSTTATATASATVTGRNCTISLTKTPDKTSVCNGSPVTYTYVVTNNSDFFTWTGSLTDDKFGTIASNITLAKGTSQTFTKTVNISGTVTNTATANGTFNDPSSTTAKATASATVTGQNCSQSQITPTNTTCSQFASGTAATLSLLQYTVKDGAINAVSPGVFFYWISLTAVPGTNTFTIHQEITTGNFDTHLFNFAAGSNAFNANCNAINGTSITVSNGDVKVTFDAGSGGTVFLGIKFDSSSVKGFTPPSGNGTAHYTFKTVEVAGSEQGLDLSQK